jgi:hypothetical protein
MPRALNVPADDVATGRLKKLPLPEDDFNRRICCSEKDGAQARGLAEFARTRPWHSVSYRPTPMVPWPPR